MWVLKKPKLSVAIQDINVLVTHCDKLDEMVDKPLLGQLYEDYDKGGGEVTIKQLAATDGKKEIIKKQYSKTSGKDSVTKLDKPLVYLRNELLDLNFAEYCPYCSINKPSQLDHYMDKSTYGQLATCRLNLVPLCGQCNWLKGDKPYTKFIHPYYSKIKKGTKFLKADCFIVRGRVCVKFSIDGVALGDAALAARLTSQISEINLDKRLKKSVNEFLTHELLRSHIKTDVGLKRMLSELLVVTKRIYGDNDWRTAVLRGLNNCAAFNIKVVDNYRKHPHVVNGGVVS